MGRCSNSRLSGRGAQVGKPARSDSFFVFCHIQYAIIVAIPCCFDERYRSHLHVFSAQCLRAPVFCILALARTTSFSAFWLLPDAKYSAPAALTRSVWSRRRDCIGGGDAHEMYSESSDIFPLRSRLTATFGYDAM